VTPACRRSPAPDTSPTPTAAAPALGADLRSRVLLSGPWRFTAAQDLVGAEARDFDDRAWAAVPVPHTWGLDPYKSAWYRLRTTLSRADPTRRVYLVFEGVAVFADVYVNGHHLGQHRGAFTRFVFDATPHVVAGENVIAVRANNDLASTADSLPSGSGKQLYNLYGGIYRKAWLVETDAVHIDPTDHASSGVYVTPTGVSAEGADLAVRTLVRNASDAARPVTVRSLVRDSKGKQVATLEGTTTVEPGARGEVRMTAHLARPRLWSTTDPQLYTIATEVQVAGRATDRAEERFGLRDFRFDGKGFTLNGAPIRLRGVGKHQETEAHLSAVTDEELRQEWALLRDLGVNYVRLAHYPHARLEYDLADEQGVLVWAENGHSNERKVTQTGDTITREMVLQNYNHASIVMWSVGNETGFLRVNRYAAVVKAIDPSRLVAYASNIGTKGKRFYPDLDLIAQNTYRGWYFGDPWEFEQKALSMRFISESGAGAVITNHADFGHLRRVVDVFEPEEYRGVIEEAHDQVVFRDHPDDIPMYTVWNFRDFGTEKYKDVRNTKGLLTYAGFKKDAWYVYRSFLRPQEPLVHLAGKTYFLRRGRADDGIKAYSNARELTLDLNGADQGKKRNGEQRHANGRRVENVFFWPAALRPGRNELRVRDGAGHEDKAVVYYAPPGVAAPAETGVVRELRSSNPQSPAWFIDDIVRDQWPFHHEFDGTADNTFDVLPEAVRGARWIATRRLSKPEARTDLSFRVAGEAAGASVYVMASESPELAARLTGAGFSDTGVRGQWRDDALQLVPYRLYVLDVHGGDRVSVPGATADYVVLIKGGV
jgi:beta-galactosidase